MPFTSLLLLFVILFCLPTCIWLWSYYMNVPNALKATAQREEQLDAGLSGFERIGKLNIKFDKSTSGVKNCNGYQYLGAANRWQNCTNRCGKNSMYEYKFIHQHENVVIGNKRLSGAYCILKEIAKCNLNTSNAIIGMDGYRCVSRFPQLLGGQYGNDIIGCTSRALHDNLLNETYTNHIPSELRIDDLDERLDTGDYRFHCVPNKNDMQLPPEYGSRFETETNICGLNDNNNGTFDFHNKKCVCKHYAGENENNLCTNCKSGWDASTLPVYTDATKTWAQTAHGNNYAYTIGRDCVDIADNDVLVNALTRIDIGRQSRFSKRETTTTNGPGGGVVSPKNGIFLLNKFPMPCGHTTLQTLAAAAAAQQQNNGADGGQARPPEKSGCEKALLYATNTYTPPALENMYN